MILIDGRLKFVFNDRVLSCSKCGLSVFHRSMMKKEQENRQNYEKDFIKMHQYCPGIKCVNCSTNFRDIQSFNLHVNQCNLEYGVTKPEVTLPTVDFNHARLMRWITKTKRSVKHFSREIGLTQDMCLNCGLKNCINGCKGIKCGFCNHFFNLFLYRNMFTSSQLNNS